VQQKTSQLQISLHGLIKTYGNGNAIFGTDGYGHSVAVKKVLKLAIICTLYVFYHHFIL